MIIDLKHNKIIEATMTEAFAKSFDSSLVPKLISKYGNDISFVQMYEDHIADGFTLSGEFYYPLTLIVSGEAKTQWIKWKLGKGDFDGKSPYAFIGSSLDFKLCDSAPDGFEDKLAGRARFSDVGLVRIKIEMMARDITFLAGRYSQTFIDEMARQLTPAIEEAMSVKGIADSSLELCLVFSPESYMEHTSENVTYRRLLITDNSGAPKDFWIKWTRLDGATAYNIAANVNSTNILFEIGEDVSQKIREKEYRFLLASKGKDKYHNSMGRKNITEWRDIIKRLIKRGEINKIETETKISKETEALTRELEAVVSGGIKDTPAAAPAAEEIVASKESDEELLKILEFAREKLEEEKPAVEEEPAEEEIEDNEELLELESFYVEDTEEPNAAQMNSDVDEDREELARQAREALLALKATEVDFGDDDAAEPEEDELPAVKPVEKPAEVKFEEPEEPADSSIGVVIVPEDPCKEEYSDDEYSEIEDEEMLEDESTDEALDDLMAIDGVNEEEDEDEEEEPVYAQAPAPAPTVNVADLEAKIRGELEAKLRLEYEMDARRRAESEAERLRVENERLVAVERRRAELKAAEDKARAEEAERLKAQIEAKVRAEQRERERMAEAARAAVEEQRRLEEEKARLERLRLEEERRLEAERQAKELEAKRAAEVERITREAEARIRAEYEAKLAHEAKLAAERIKAAEEKANADTEQAAPEAAEPTEEEVNRNYTYTSKTVKLQFRRSVDPNITARIHEIIKATLDYYGKSKVYLKIRATVPDTETVLLEFIKIPMEEMELLGNIIKVLGNSGLGIAKAIVE